MSRLLILDSAMNDIVELTEYLTEYSDTAGDALTAVLSDCFERLGAFPMMGRERSEISPGVRSVPLNRLRVTVFYLFDPEGDAVMISRVMRQERNLD